MPDYIENPKTKGSGILCCIPQQGRCPNNCADCFFQSGRSYLEPLDKHLPNMPDLEKAQNHVVRVNDGNDSNVQRDLVLGATCQYPMRFYNTACPNDLAEYDAPVVLTVNPGSMTEWKIYELDTIPVNLMFVRVRTNTWCLSVVRAAVYHYTPQGVPVVLTFMAYYDNIIPDGFQGDYVYRKRTLNSYWAITTAAWRKAMAEYEDNPLVYSCGKIEGERGTTLCKHCGNCLREYFATMERTRNA